MKILKINSSKETISNSNTKKFYKAISLASLSTLALGFVSPADIVQAVIGKTGANQTIRFYGSSGSRVIKAPHSRLTYTTTNRPNTNPFKTTTNPFKNTNPFKSSTNTNPFKNTNPFQSNGSTNTKPNTKPSPKPNTNPTTSVGTQTNLGVDKSTNTPKPKPQNPQFPINDDGFDDISLGSTSSNSSKGSLSVNLGSLDGTDGTTTTNKKGLSKKDKVALGAVGATVTLGTTIGLAAGLAPKGDSNSGNKDTTTPPNSVPTPIAPSYSTNGFVSNPDGFLFIDEKA